MGNKNKNQPNKFRAILFKKNQHNKNFKNSQLGCNKEKVNKISQKLLKIKMNQKKKLILQHADMKVVSPNQQKNHKQLNQTKTNLKKKINNPVKKIQNPTNSKP